jgi:hypothetical protein
MDIEAILFDVKDVVAGSLAIIAPKANEKGLLLEKMFFGANT